MDARPQRPRVLRVNDENMAPPALTANGNLTGKTLHQRTKSVPAFSSVLPGGAKAAAAKKVLGEVNANTRFLKRATDDSDIQKASPGKIAMVKDEPIVTAQFIRPASRLVAAKAVSSQSVSKSVAVATIKEQIQSEGPKKVVAKKSTKVLRDVQPAEPSAVDNKRPLTQAPVHHTLAAPAKAIVQPLPQSTEQSASHIGVLQRQEVRKTENIPLRGDQVSKVASAQPANPMQLGFQSDQDYLSYIAANVTLQKPGIAHSHLVPEAQQPVEQYYDAPEEEYYYDEATGYTTARSFGLQGDSTGGMTTCLAPLETETSRLEIAAAKQIVDHSRTAEDVEDELWDTSMVAEYGEEIFEYMRHLETRMTPNPFYMDKQTEIQWSMRAVLMDWIVQVHQRFNLLPETLFLTANYIDRFLSAKIVSLGKLQLVGATAIFVAAKYEEVQCPTIQEIIYMVDGGYSADELLKAERFMLSMLQYELGWPGPMSFLRRISKADDYDLETRTLAKYFLEVTIMDERFVGATPSWLAAGAHCIARLMLQKGSWTPAHVFYSNYTYSQLRPLVTTILECCEDPRKHHGAVFDKYADKRYRRASTFVAGEMSKGFKLGHMGDVDAAAVGKMMW